MAVRMTADTTTSAPCPKRSLIALGKLLDASNLAAPALSAHKNAIEAKRADEAAKSKSTSSVAHSSTLSAPLIMDTLQTSSDSDLELQQPHKCFNTHKTFYTDI